MDAEPRPAPATPPDPFRQTFVAMLAARALITATSLGVFDALSDGRATPATLADRLQLDPAGTGTLLVALRSLGYVAPAGDGTVALTEVAARLLVRASPASVATFVGPLNVHHWELLGRLDDVLAGRAAPGWHERPLGDPRWAAYVEGLFELSRGEHDANAALVPVDAPETLLDVGGAHGAFAMAMCRRHAGLRATVLDLPASAAEGRRIVARAGMADRVTFRDGDALQAPLGAGQGGAGLDVASMFNLLQHLPQDRARALIRRVREALRPGGWLVVGETERPEPGEPVDHMGALTGLLFYLMTGTRTYTRRELAGWLVGAGLEPVAAHRNPRSPWRVVHLARRPQGDG